MALTEFKAMFIIAYDGADTKKNQQHSSNAWEKSNVHVHLENLEIDILSYDKSLWYSGIRAPDSRR